PAVLLAAWIAIRFSRTPYTDYLALRWTSWQNFLIGAVSLAVLVGGWDLLSRSLGREVTPGFMGEVLQSAQAAGALWLLVVAFCVAAPMSEEILARGFLYRGRPSRAKTKSPVSNLRSDGCMPSASAKLTTW